MAAFKFDRLRTLIEEELPSLVALRHDLHAHPELQYEERRTSGIVQDELRRASVEFRAGLAGGTGVLAHIPGHPSREHAGHAIGLRADMDALPIEENNSFAYVSTARGKMHACGHDGHTTILIGAARVLARIAAAHELPQPVVLIFQPAEEGGAGARRMLDDGCLNGSVLGAPVKALFALHAWPSLALGSVTTRRGPMTAATEDIRIVIEGRGGHAAFPHLTRDPIVAAAAIITALQSITSRNVNPLDAAVISVTQCHAGSTFNVIPDCVELGGTVRSLTRDSAGLLKRRVHEVVQGVAAAHECRATIEYNTICPATHNAPQAVDVFESVAVEALGRDRVVPMEQPVMGGEDFSFYTSEVPSCFFCLGLQRDGKTAMPGLHHSSFDFNDDAIAVGVELFCRLALRKYEGTT